MEINFQRKILDNGMTILFEKRNLPVVSMAIAVRNGAINEQLEEKGISHFIEHMLYKGTKNRNANQIASSIEKNGGELNGFTGEDITAFWCKMPSEGFDISMNVLTDMVKNPLFDEKELEKERKVIFEEIKLYHDSPIYYVYSELQKYLYEGTLSAHILGSVDTLSEINRQKIIEKFGNIYTPNNLILCVVGDADFNKIVEFAEKNFGTEKKNVPQMDIKLINGRKIEKRKGIDQSNLIFAYHVPVSGNDKNYAAQILNVLMAGGMSSRLFSEIREKRNLAYSIRGTSEISKIFAYNMIYVGTSKDKIEEVEKLIVMELEKISKGLDEKEFNEVKKQMIGNYKISMEDSQMQMVGLLKAEIDGDAHSFYDFEKKINEVNIDDVRQIAKEAAKKYSFFALVPED